VIAPAVWGAVSVTPNNAGGQRWTVPAGNAMLPVGGISWHTAAIYCNWLCNGKSQAASAFMNGAYDVSTFGYQGSSGIFTDQLVHNANAQYWIPTLDEWIKAAHYDPNRNGPSQGGWWLSSNRTDTAIPYGPPGVNVRLVPPPPYGPDPNGPLAQANGGWDSQFPGYSPYDIPLGSYNSTSPWGLFDVAGGTSEWTEEVGYTNGVFPTDRGFSGTAWVEGGHDQLQFQNLGGQVPSIGTFNLGFRVAAAIPSPASGLVVASGLIVAGRRRSRPKHQVGL
jgi:formylglycine-generating enzyme required for sulfatase activity